MKSRIFTLLMPVFAAAFLFGCSESNSVAAEPESTILDVVLAQAEEGEFTVLKAAVIAISENTDIDLIAALSNTESQITVFAPTDAAFTSLLEALQVNDLAELVEAVGGYEALANVVLYHVTAGSQDAASVVGLTSIETLSGASLTKEAGSTVLIHGGGTSTIVDTDIMASNGIIHVIDTVLLPPSE